MKNNCDSKSMSGLLQISMRIFHSGKLKVISAHRISESRPYECNLPATKINNMIRKSVLLVFLIFGAKAFSQDFDAELVSYKTFIEIKNGKLVHDISYEIKINNRRGEKYTKVLV